jgi:hypothetical protein
MSRKFDGLLTKSCSSTIAKDVSKQSLHRLERQLIKACQDMYDPQSTADQRNAANLGHVRVSELLLKQDYSAEVHRLRMLAAAIEALGNDPYLKLPTNIGVADRDNALSFDDYAERVALEFALNEWPVLREIARAGQSRLEAGSQQDRTTKQPRNSRSTGAEA